MIYFLFLKLDGEQVASLDSHCPSSHGQKHLIARLCTTTKVSQLFFPLMILTQLNQPPGLAWHVKMLLKFRFTSTDRRPALTSFKTLLSFESSCVCDNLPSQVLSCGLLITLTITHVCSTIQFSPTLQRCRSAPFRSKWQILMMEMLRNVRNTFPLHSN